MDAINQLVRHWTIYKSGIPRAKDGELVIDDQGKIVNLSPTVEGFLDYLEKIVL